MPRPKGKRAPVRMSVSMDLATHTRLLQLAGRHDVSVAWMVRKAIAEFMIRHEEEDQAELPLRRMGHEGRTTSE